MMIPKNVRKWDFEGQNECVECCIILQISSYENCDENNNENKEQNLVKAVNSRKQHIPRNRRVMSEVGEPWSINNVKTYFSIENEDREGCKEERTT